MCFHIGSRHLGCWGQNTSRIRNKEVYATLFLQANLIGDRTTLATVDACKAKCTADSACLSVSFKAAVGACRLSSASLTDSPDNLKKKTETQMAFQAFEKVTKSVPATPTHDAVHTLTYHEVAHALAEQAWATINYSYAIFRRKDNLLRFPGKSLTPSALPTIVSLNNMFNLLPHVCGATRVA